MNDFNKTLLIVYKEKDEELFDYFKSIIVWDDDLGDQIIGTEDGTVRVMGLSEKDWLAKKNKKGLSDKYIFIGDIEDVKDPYYIFDMHGVKFGEIDNDSIKIDVNASYEWSEEEYKVFLQEINNMLIVFNDINNDSIGCGSGNFKKRKRKSTIDGEKHDKKMTKRNWIMDLLCFIPIIGAIQGIVAIQEYSEVKKDESILRKQMLLYGICKLYYVKLDDFIKQ